jgi:hypothetical protein
MALTDSQELALFTILEIPYSTKHNTLDDQGLISYEDDADALVYQGTAAAKSAVEAHLALMTDAALTQLALLLDAFIDLGFDNTKILGGSIGNIQGITSDPDLDRDTIKKQVIILVPFYRKHEDFIRANSSNMVRLHR